jgi:soluble lytic murein transglycosylase-like protein
MSATRKALPIRRLPMRDGSCKEISTLTIGPRSGLPAKLLFSLTGIAVSAALCGCTSTSGTTHPQNFTETSAAAGADAGFQLDLPETVAVVPEPSGRAPVAASTQVAETQGAAPAAAFAGPTPGASSSAVAAVTAQGQPAVESRPAVAAAASDKASGAAIPTETAKDLSKMFPAAPTMPAHDATVVASIEPVSYSGPVPLYLAPAPLPSRNAFAHTEAPRNRGEIEKLVEKYARLYQVPVELVRHVVNRESTFNPKAYNHGHWGLMQIKHQTARGMGYDGPASGLFDAETNLKYAVKYLRGAWLVAGRDQKRADWLYQTGYYYEAKRKGMLELTGLGIDRKRRRAAQEDVRLDPERLVRPPVLPVGAPG